MKTIKAFISGSVQGVFFRKFVKEKADELKVCGFVRNLDDGRVEVVVEGKDESVDKLIATCKNGLKHAEVKTIETASVPHQGFDSFKILTM